MLKKINYYRNQELLYIDFFQKYLLKDFNQVPEIKEINLITNLNSPDLKNVSEEFLQNYMFFILYSLGGMLPSVELYKKREKITGDKKDFILKLILNHKKDINSFLDNTMLELLEKRDVKYFWTNQRESIVTVQFDVYKNLDIIDISNNSKLNFKYSFKFKNKNKILKKEWVFYKKYVPFWIL